MKTVSVIIPTHNRAHYIGEAIGSVIHQDIKNCELEVIVVDDGSTDNTQNVVEGFGEKIKYIYQHNQGAGKARNRGIEEARGDWIAFLDSDDRWLPDKLALQFQVLEAFPEYKAVHTNFYTFEGNQIIIPKGLEYWATATKRNNKVNWGEFYNRRFNSSDYGIIRAGSPFAIYSGNLFRSLLVAPLAACWTLLIHRDCLGQDIRFAETYPTWEDYWFFCRLSEYHDLLFLDCATAENRGHTGPRLTQAQRTKTLECYLDMCEKIYLPSHSKNRPPDEVIKQYYQKAKVLLFKEYLKNGNRFKARTLFQSERCATGFRSDLALPLYRLAALFPFEVTNCLVKFKKYFFSE